MRGWPTQREFLVDLWRRHGALGLGGRLLALPARRWLGAEFTVALEGEVGALRRNLVKLQPLPADVALRCLPAAGRRAELWQRLRQLNPHVQDLDKRAVDRVVVAERGESLLGYWCFRDIGTSLQDEGLYVARSERGRALAAHLLAGAIADLPADARVAARTTWFNRAGRHALRRAGLRVVGLWLLLAALALACGSPLAPKAPTPHPQGLTQAIPDPHGKIALLPSPLQEQGFIDGLAVLGDCDGDGRLDVFSTAHGKLLQQDAQGHFALLRTFEPHAATGQDALAPALGSWHNIPNGAFADLDGDGNLDLIVAGTDMDLYAGKGSCTFGDAQPLPKPCALGTPAYVDALDLDQDGLLDLVIGCDGAPDPPYRLLLARGDGTFEAQVPTAAPFIHKTIGLPVFAAHFDDVDGDGILDGFFLVDNNMGWFSWGVVNANSATDLPIFHRQDDLAHDVSDKDGMALSTLDIDRDGRADYFLPGTDFGDIVLWNRAPRELYNIADFAQLGAHPKHTSWTSFALDADFDGWSDLLVLSVISPDAVANGGDQRARPSLHMNRHDGTFVDVGATLIDANASFFALNMACGDLASDGHVSCLVPSTSPAMMLRNEIEPLGRWIGVRLRGTVSAPNAHGARVIVEGVQPPLTAYVGGQTATFGNHDDGVLLAAGDAKTVNLRIEWPSGLVQHVTDAPTNAYTTVTEPRVLQLGQRVLHAGGQASVEVLVDPQAAGTDVVSLERLGAGSWAGPLAKRPDGLLSRTLVAPAVPGEARIVVQLQHVPLRVRPRVRFE